MFLRCGIIDTVRITIQKYRLQRKHAKTHLSTRQRRRGAITRLKASPERYGHGGRHDTRALTSDGCAGNYRVYDVTWLGTPTLSGSPSVQTGRVLASRSWGRSFEPRPFCRHLVSDCAGCLDATTKTGLCSCVGVVPNSFVK